MRIRDEKENRGNKSGGKASIVNQESDARSVIVMSSKGDQESWILDSE